jgi:peptide/nickel transport system ATP-binding protein
VARPRLREIPGVVPRLDRLAGGCRFAERCPRVLARCRAEAPPLAAPARADPSEGAREVRCFFPVDDPPPTPTGAGARAGS